MKIVLATGIYPPAIGGPATYVKHLADELSKEHEVVVVTYGKCRNAEMQKDRRVEWVSLRLPIVRWFLYARKLRKVGKDADVVYCFSSISSGVPLVLSMLKKPKRVLRLGGDFFWERYTDWGGRKSLRGWYRDHGDMATWLNGKLLSSFDHIVFSTKFQEEIYEKAYRKLPEHSVIENALVGQRSEVRGQRKDGKNLLFMGRFVRFKNLRNLIRAMVQLPEFTLTLVGDGPERSVLISLIQTLHLEDRVTVLPPVSGEQKQKVFAEHDLLVLPSLTEISPNVALEAKAAGLPVLLTQENGLSGHLVSAAMNVQPLKSVDEIVKAIQSEIQVVDFMYDTHRPWSQVARETEQLFQVLTTNY